MSEKKILLSCYVIHKLVFAMQLFKNSEGKKVRKLISKVKKKEIIY